MITLIDSIYFLDSISPSTSSEYSYSNMGFEFLGIMKGWIYPSMNDKSSFFSLKVMICSE